MTGYLFGGLLVACFLVMALTMRPSSDERPRGRDKSGRDATGRSKSGSWQA